MGDGDKWDQFLFSPVAWTKPIQYSQLAQLVGEGENVATNNSVTETIQGVIEQVQMYRDMFLQGPGDGSLASIDSTTGGNFINLRSTITGTIDGRGAHLVKAQQKVQIMSNAAGGYVLRGSCTIQNVFASLGSTQQIQVDAIPAGVVAGDLVIVDGAAPGAPQFINGIPFFVNTATLGNVYGISRALPYVVASGLNLANTAQVTKPVFIVAENQIKQRLGKKGTEKPVLPDLPLAASGAGRAGLHRHHRAAAGWQGGKLRLHVPRVHHQWPHGHGERARGSDPLGSASERSVEHDQVGPGHVLVQKPWRPNRVSGDGPDHRRNHRAGVDVLLCCRAMVCK